MKDKSLKDSYVRMNENFANSDLEYYFITIVADENGKASWSTQTQWCGFEDEDRKIELREASFVHPDRMIMLYRNELKEGCMVVDTAEYLTIFMLLGGHAVVESELARSVLGEFLKPKPSVRTGFTGFQSTKNMQKSVFQRAPTKKQRMRILKRDEYRCKVCGRAPHNNVDITLHIHHIRPWADSGLTHDENLITLCHTCHEGLDPHYEISLYNLLEPSGKVLDDKISRTSHTEAVKRYREESFRRALEKST